MATLLRIVRDACDEVGLPRPASVIGSNDQTVRTMFSLSSREGRELVRVADWTGLQRLHTVTTVANQEEYALPADFDRVIIDTEWDSSQTRPWIGPVSPQGWRLLKESVVGSGLVGSRWRIARSSTSNARVILIDPVPATSGAEFTFEYISKHWVQNEAGDTTRADWVADTDEALLDDDLMRLGLVLRYKRAKDLPFVSEAQEYQDMLAALRSQDRPARTVRLARRRFRQLIGPENVPETGWGP